MPINGEPTKIGGYCKHCHEMLTVENISFNGIRIRPQCRACFKIMSEGYERTPRTKEQMREYMRRYRGSKKVYRPRKVAVAKAVDSE